MAQITSRKELEKWLKDKPADWAQVIAARAALRVLPYAIAEQIPQKWVEDSALGLIRAMSMAWAARNFPAHDMAAAADAAAAGRSDSTPAYAAAARAAYAAYASDAATAAAYAADAATAAADNVDAVWESIDHDCAWLEKEDDHASAAERLTYERLWLAGEPTGWSKARDFACNRLGELTEKGDGPNQQYQVWIDWYNRRVDGKEAAFDIPYDTGCIEDKRILARLAEANDEGFWNKGALYVNITLQSWIEKARERAASKTTPLQETDATAYGVNSDDKVDRLPVTDQQHLRDVPDQRIIYRDVRESALELQREGQRLGARLNSAVLRFLYSMPENFADAECYSVWRDGNALRRIHLAHRAVANGEDYDDKRLDPAMAEMLGDLLDRYNLFAFGDDGLRAKDEAAVPPQERAKTKNEAAKAAPLINALLSTPEIVTDNVRDDIIADRDDQTLPEGDPYDDQALVQSNKVKRNIIAALLSGAAKQVKQSGKSVREGAEREVGAMIVRAPLIAAFVATHFQAIKTYAETAYAKTSLQWLWEALSKLSGLL